MRLRTLVLILLTGALTLSPGIASGASHTHRDAVGDVVRYTVAVNSEDEPTETVDPSVREGDVTSTTFSHQPRRVVATMRYRELTRRVDMLHGFAFRTNKKVLREVTVTASAKTPRGRHRIENRKTRKVRCRGLQHRIDYAANTVRVSVPRACLERPSWIQGGAASIRVDASRLDSAEIIDLFGDDAHSPKMRDNVAFGPRLRRG